MVFVKGALVHPLGLVAAPIFTNVSWHISLRMHKHYCCWIKITHTHAHTRMQFYFSSCGEEE